MNKKLTFLMLGAFMLTGVNEASATTTIATDIADKCSGYGYDLLPDYQSESCGSCHDDSNAKPAYDSGNYEYFCPAPMTPVCTDADGDGFFVEGDSCNTLADFDDNNSAAYPGATENCTDGIDNDGNGLTDGDDPNAVDCPAACTDQDKDGYFVEGDACGTLADFDDNNSSAYPGATENCTDGIDNDGNGLTDSADPDAVDCPVACTDNDMDGFSIEGGECGAVDCNDENASINPGAAEVCTDAIDNNCNGLVDTADMNAIDCPLDCTDADGDGYSVEGGNCGAMDCDDGNADVNPGALEICTDNIDNNCDGLADTMDAVCQNDDGNDDVCERPWWRCKGKKHDRWNKWRDYFCNKDSQDGDTDKDDSDEKNSDEGDSDEDESDDDREEHRWFKYRR
jgi:hypothetical protein